MNGSPARDASPASPPTQPPGLRPPISSPLLPLSALRSLSLFVTTLPKSSSSSISLPLALSLFPPPPPPPLSFSPWLPASAGESAVHTLLLFVWNKTRFSVWEDKKEKTPLGFLG